MTILLHSPLSSPPAGIEAAFRGALVRGFESNGITLVENLYTAESVLPAHVHHQSFLSLTLQGGYTERHTSKAVEFIPSSVAFHPALEQHSVQMGRQNVRCLNVEIPEHYIARLRETHAADAQFVFDVGGPMVWLASRLHQEMSTWSAASPLVAEGLVLEILGVLARVHCEAADRREPRWMRALDEILRTEFDGRVTVNELAARVGVHPVHLSRTWRRFRGCSIGESVHKARIEAACQRLRSGAASLADVALEVGFADQTHFSRIFKKITGLTPGTYRGGFRPSRRQ